MPDLTDLDRLAHDIAGDVQHMPGYGPERYERIVAAIRRHLRQPTPLEKELLVACRQLIRAVKSSTAGMTAQETLAVIRAKETIAKAERAASEERTN